MLFQFLLLYFGICRAVILLSNDLQNEISSELFTPEDLLKARLVQKNWIAGVENVFMKIAEAPENGLFLHKSANKVHVCGISQKSAIVDRSLYYNYHLYRENDPAKFFCRLIRSDVYFGNDIMNGLAKIVNVEDENFHGNVIVSRLCKYYPESATILIKQGWNIDVDKALDYALSEGNADLMEVLLDHGAQVDGGDARDTPLMKAVRFHKFASVKVLLVHDANLNLRDYGGITAGITILLEFSLVDMYTQELLLIITAIKKYISSRFNAFRTDYTMIFIGLILLFFEYLQELLLLTPKYFIYYLHYPFVLSILSISFLIIDGLVPLF